MTAFNDFAAPLTDGYDVFLSYSSLDLTSVEAIATALKEEGLSVWFDKWRLRPGDTWQPEIEKGITASRSIAVFIGPNGISSWELPEVRAAIDLAVKSKTRVIPVLLPGANATSDGIPLMLRNFQFCVMERDRSDCGGSIDLGNHRSESTPKTCPTRPARASAKGGAKPCHCGH